VRAGGRNVGRRVQQLFSTRGPGFRRLAQSHAANAAADTLVALALAGTLFFDVPPATARDRVALWLLLTLAPFAVLGPALGSIYQRFPRSYRTGLALSAVLRAVLVVMMAFNTEGLWIYPLAFGVLILSRLHGISKNSLLPVVLSGRAELVAANSQLARIGVLAGACAVPVGALIRTVPALLLIVAAAVYLWAAGQAVQIPDAVPAEARAPRRRQERRRITLPRTVRVSRVATGWVRLLNGLLLLTVAFAFRDLDAGILDFGALLGAASFGYFLSSFSAPALERRVAEEPMMVAGLTVEAGAAFIAAQVFNLGSAAALAAAAGFAWGTAKFGFDGLLQSTLPPEERGTVFTWSETWFQLAWVVGAVLPVALQFDTEIWLVGAGILALFAQVLFISGLLVPIAEERRRRVREAEIVGDTPGDVTDLL
jgi:hypothetical protein